MKDRILPWSGFLCLEEGGPEQKNEIRIKNSSQGGEGGGADGSRGGGRADRVAGRQQVGRQDNDHEDGTDYHEDDHDGTEDYEDEDDGTDDHEDDHECTDDYVDDNMQKNSNNNNDNTEGNTDDNKKEADSYHLQ